MKTQTVTYHQDPGHGWLEVDRAQLVELDIADQISRYSYVRGPVAFLEEDCDASLFVQACNAKGITVHCTPKHTNGDSFIRRLPRFQA